MCCCDRNLYKFHFPVSSKSQQKLNNVNKFRIVSSIVCALYLFCNLFKWINWHQFTWMITYFWTLVWSALRYANCASVWNIQYINFNICQWSVVWCVSIQSNLEYLQDLFDSQWVCFFQLSLRISFAPTHPFPLHLFSHSRWLRTIQVHDIQ